MLSNNLIPYTITSTVTENVVSSVFGMFVVFIALIVLSALFLFMWVVISNTILKNKDFRPTKQPAPQECTPNMAYTQAVQHIEAPSPVVQPAVNVVSAQPVVQSTASVLEVSPHSEENQNNAPVGENLVVENLAVGATHISEPVAELTAPKAVESTTPKCQQVPTEPTSVNYNSLILSDVDETTAAIIMALVSYNIKVPLEKLRFSSIKCIGMSESLSDPGTTVVTTLASRPISIPIGSVNSTKLKSVE